MRGRKPDAANSSSIGVNSLKKTKERTIRIADFFHPSGQGFELACLLSGTHREREGF
jgi:hypothetical protein